PARARMDKIEADSMWARLSPAEAAVPLAQGATKWFGNANMYCWSLGGLPSNDTLTAVLMSVVWWLYRELADGQDVTPYLERVMRESRSVGLAGMLVDVGK